MSANDDWNKSKIVVAVDDEPSNLAIVDVTVRAAGYSFIGLGSGAEILSLVAKITPRLILLDVDMPEMNGFETCRKLRAIARMDRVYSRLETVPILFLTARKTLADVREGMAAGGNDFIVKPFDPVKMTARIEHWVKQGTKSAPGTSKVRG